MFAHGPSCLRGPLSRARKCWSAATEGHASQPSTQQASVPPENPSSDERPFRADLVARVRRAIADGTYDTPEKFEIALDRLMRQLDEE